MADPGFPVGGGVDLVGGGVDSRGGYVLKILYVKTKELGPLGGARAGGAPLDPPMIVVHMRLDTHNTQRCYPQDLRSHCRIQTYISELRHS